MIVDQTLNFVGSISGEISGHYGDVAIDLELERGTRQEREQEHAWSPMVATGLYPSVSLGAPTVWPWPIGHDLSGGHKLSTACRW